MGGFFAKSSLISMNKEEDKDKEIDNTRSLPLSTGIVEHGISLGTC